MGFEP